MARKKQYIEKDVIDKAMQLFWRNGYKNTSMQMLEKEMGINKFSIYARFGNKQGIFLESLKCYKGRISTIFKNFKQSQKGRMAIKDFFYDSVAICSKEGHHKGCLITTTYMEFSESEDDVINNQMTEFIHQLKELFIEKLRIDTPKNEETLLREANFLLLAKHGLAAASRVNSKQEIEDYIETTFKHI